jgi:hypothetical protein
VPTFVAVLRAAFDAETDGEAAVVREQMLMALEDVLDEEADEVECTELAEFSNATELAELSILMKQLRNKLIATKRRDAVNLAQSLDMFAHGIDLHLTPDDIGPQYDRSNFLELCDAIWNGKATPTT